jgi:hypothetical protein
MAERLKPTYFENQKQAASILGFQEYDLKEWKAAGCPAFRHGRIYHAELLEWVEKYRPNARRRGRRPGDAPEAPNREYAIGRAMLGLADCANFGVLTADQYFELGKTIVEAAGNEEVRQIFTDAIYGRLRSEYSELLEAFNAHPKMTYWIIRERLMTPEEKAELPVELPAAPRNHPQRRKSRTPAKSQIGNTFPTHGLIDKSAANF